MLEAGVDQRETPLQVRDHLQLADGADSRRELDRIDRAPGRVDHEEAVAAVDRLRDLQRILTPRQAAIDVGCAGSAGQLAHPRWERSTETSSSSAAATSGLRRISIASRSFIGSVRSRKRG